MADIKTYKIKEKNIIPLLEFLKENLRNYYKIESTHHENGVSSYILEVGKYLVFDQKNLELITINVNDRLKCELGWVINGGC